MKMLILIVKQYVEMLKWECDHCVLRLKKPCKRWSGQERVKGKEMMDCKTAFDYVQKSCALLMVGYSIKTGYL